MCLFESCNVFIGDLDLPLLVIIFIIILTISVNNILFLCLLSHVSLVGQHYHRDISAAMLLNLFEPPINIDERLFVSQIKDHQNAISSFVIGLGDRPVPLLACSVPYLQSYG